MIFIGMCYGTLRDATHDQQPAADAAASAEGENQQQQ